MHSRVVTRQFSKKTPQLAHPRNRAVLEPTNVLPSAGLAIYAARGLRSGTAEITAVVFTACGGWQVVLKIEVRKLGIFQVASYVISTSWHFQNLHPKLAEIGVQKKRVSMRKLKLRQLNAENCVRLAFYAFIPRQRPFVEKTAVNT